MSGSKEALSIYLVIRDVTARESPPSSASSLRATMPV